MRGKNCDYDKQKIMKSHDDTHEKIKKLNQGKVRVRSVVKERRKEIKRKMVQKRIRHQKENKWHNIIEDNWCN